MIMKKIIFRTVVVLVCATSVANAQKISSAKVPESVRTSFAKTHPKVSKVSWELEKGNYEAGFTINGEETSELYNTSGVLLESETEIKVASLPSGILPYVKTHYKGASVGEAAKITRNNGEVNYEAAIKGKDLIFDGKGNFLKEIKD